MIRWNEIHYKLAVLKSSVDDIATACTNSNTVDEKSIKAAQEMIQAIEQDYEALVSQVPTLRTHLDQTFESLEDLRNTVRADRHFTKDEVALLKERMQSVFVASVPEENANVLQMEDIKQKDRMIGEIALAYASRGDWEYAWTCAKRMSGFGQFTGQAGAQCCKVLEAIYDKLYLQLRETGPTDIGADSECDILLDFAEKIRLHKKGGEAKADKDESIQPIIKLMPLLIKHGAIKIAVRCNQIISSYDNALAAENQKLIDARKKKMESGS